MIIEVIGKEIEKIKGDFESYLNGLNMVGEISYSQYSELYDEGTKQIQRAYELGKTELENKIADIKANCDLAIEGRDIKIKELEKENAELKEEIDKKQHLADVRLEQELETYQKLHIKSKEKLDTEIALDEVKDQLTKAKDLIEDMYDKIPASHSDYYKDVMERATQFLKEIEKC